MTFCHLVPENVLQSLFTWIILNKSKVKKKKRKKSREKKKKHHRFGLLWGWVSNNRSSTFKRTIPSTHTLCFYMDIEGILILLMNSKYFTWVRNTQCVINFSPASLSQHCSPFARAVSSAYCVYHACVCVCVCVCAHNTVLSPPKDVAAVAV